MGAKYCVAEMSLSLRQGRLLPAVLTAGDEGEWRRGGANREDLRFPEEGNGAVDIGASAAAEHKDFFVGRRAH